MAELADALGSGPSSRQGSAGSSPVFGTLIRKDLRQIAVGPSLCAERQPPHIPPLRFHAKGSAPHIPRQDFAPRREKTSSAIAVSSSAK